MIEKIMIGFFIFMIISAVIGIVLCVFGLIKNENTYRMHRIILSAIIRYQMEQHENGKEIKVYIMHMESYDTTYERWWDWGYKNILPPDKFKIIKPYIVTRRGK